MWRSLALLLLVVACVCAREERVNKALTPELQDNLVQLEKKCKNKTLDFDEAPPPGTTYCYHKDSASSDIELRFCPYDTVCVGEKAVTNPGSANMVTSFLRMGCKSTILGDSTDEHQCGAVMCPSEHYLFVMECCQGPKCNDPEGQIRFTNMSASNCVGPAGVSHGCDSSKGYQYCSSKNQCVQNFEGGIGFPCVGNINNLQTSTKDTSADKLSENNEKQNQQQPLLKDNEEKAQEPSVKNNEKQTEEPQVNKKQNEEPQKNVKQADTPQENETQKQEPQDAEKQTEQPQVKKEQAKELQENKNQKNYEPERVELQPGEPEDDGEPLNAPQADEFQMEQEDANGPPDSGDQTNEPQADENQMEQENEQETGGPQDNEKQAEEPQDNEKQAEEPQDNEKQAEEPQDNEEQADEPQDGDNPAEDPQGNENQPQADAP